MAADAPRDRLDHDGGPPGDLGVDGIAVPTYPDEDAQMLADRADQDFAVSVIQGYATDRLDRAPAPGATVAVRPGKTAKVTIHLTKAP